MDAATGSGKTLAFLLPVVERLAALEAPLKRHQVWGGVGGGSCGLVGLGGAVCAARLAARPVPTFVALLLLLLLQVGAVIVSPTRELAKQIFNVAQVGGVGCPPPHTHTALCGHLQGLAPS